MATFYVIRHASAGSREDWSGDDRLRPLTSKGLAEAERLVASLKRFPITAVFSSPYRRCLQTVEPVARSLGLAVQPSSDLGEGRGLAGAMRLMSDPKLDQAVLSTHGDIVWELAEDLVRRRVIRAGEGGFEKASTWVVELDRGRPVLATFIPPP